MADIMRPPIRNCCDRRACNPINSPTRRETASGISVRPRRRSTARAAARRWRRSSSGGVPKKRRASSSANPASRVASRKAAPRSAALVSFTRSGGWQRRQAEADVDGGEQARLHRLVGAADHRLERRDHVADHIFRRVVQQHGKPPRPVDIGRHPPRNRFDQQRRAGPPKRCAAPWSGRSSGRRGQGHGRYPRSRRRAARGRAGRAGGRTACAARRAAFRTCPGGSWCVRATGRGAGGQALESGRANRAGPGRPKGSAANPHPVCRTPYRDLRLWNNRVPGAGRVESICPARWRAGRCAAGAWA